MIEFATHYHTYLEVHVSQFHDMTFKKKLAFIHY
jgi:hypothetical protein